MPSAKQSQVDDTPESIAPTHPALVMGFLLGLSAGCLFLAGELPRPNAPTGGIPSDWRAVGGYLRQAMRAHD